MALAGVLFAASALASASYAGRVFPRAPIDAGTPNSAVGLGAAIGDRQGWAAFAQRTAGRQRLYARFARNGVFAASPQFVDQGNRIRAGGLVGDRHGNALAVWEERVGGNGVVFSRRLANGAFGAVVRVTPAGSDANFSDLTNPFERGRTLAMNARGAAALCYDDGNDQFIATLGAGAASWVSHKLPRSCINDSNSDLGVDDRGNAVALTLDNNTLFADKVIRGQVVSEMVTNDVMDQTSIGLGPGGTAIAVGRDDTMDVFARRKADVAQGGPWTRVGGNLEDGLLIGDGRSPEDPYAALDGRGNGVVAFRDNAINGGQGIYRLVRGGVPGAGGALFTSIGRSARIRLGVDRLGRPFTAYSKARTLDANGETVTRSAYGRVFARGAPGRERALAPGVLDSGAPNMLGFAVDLRGNFLGLASDFTDMNTSRVLGTLGDFSRPRLAPRAFRRRPRARRRVRLNSHATDSFRTLRNGDVLWRVPRGVRIVRAARKRGRRARGKVIRVRFRHAGRFRIRVTAGDGSGNRRTKTLRIRVRRAR